MIDAPIVEDRIVGINPSNGKQIVAKTGRFGPYVTELEPAVPEAEAPEAAETVNQATGEVTEAAEAPAKKKPAKKKSTEPKPRTASLFKSMEVETVDLDTALALLDLPRVVGIDPESETEITAQNGRYGPYLKKGTDSRSLTTEEQIFEIDLAGALEVFAQPKYGGRKASSALKEFAEDPESGKPIKIKDGRFGAYVTDGITNVTIPRGETFEDIEFERAVQMLADKRAKGPAKPKAGARKKPAAKKPAAKKPAASAGAATSSPAEQ